MKKTLILSAVVFAASVFAFAGVKGKANGTDKKPEIVVTNGFYSGSMISDGNGRSVLIVNTQTGDFEVFDIDRQGLDRKTNDVYYSSIKYNRSQGTRQIIKYTIQPETAAGNQDFQQ